MSWLASIVSFSSGTHYTFMIVNYSTFTIQMKFHESWNRREKKNKKGKKYVSLLVLLQMPAPLPPVNISHQLPLWFDQGLQEGGWPVPSSESPLSACGGMALFKIDAQLNLCIASERVRQNILVSGSGAVLQEIWRRFRLFARGVAV